MKTIKIIESDGTVRLFSPLYVKSAKMVHSSTNEDWCIVLNLDDQVEPVYTILCKNRAEMDRKFDMVKEALESISK